MGKSNSTIEENLFINRLKPDFTSHIKNNQGVCRTCYGKECTKFCPANVFAWSEEEQNLIVNYENCLECGACKVGCPYEVIKFQYPKSGYGINLNTP